MEKKKAIEIACGSKYYDIIDLRFNREVGIMLSKDELTEFFNIKDELIENKSKCFKSVPLKVFNSKHCFYVVGNYLKDWLVEYAETFINDCSNNKSLFSKRHYNDIMSSSIYSEIEGSLNTENVGTTHKHIEEVCKKEIVTDKNDIIIVNMKNAINYIINERPAFNKDNLLKLYNTLSEGCLKDEDKLKTGSYYRDDEVSVGGYDGADSSKIEECMDSLFAFVNDPKSIKEHYMVLPYICQYYILYVHPYFDYNGRTARMVSLWLIHLFEMFDTPLLLSEAINEEKNKYYNAIINTRNSRNDLTYFLGFILENAVKYTLVYKNMEEIKSKLSKDGEFMTHAEAIYFKKIIIHNCENYFNHKMFLEYINSDISKQACLKVLNHFTKYGLLEKSINKKKETIYKVNQEFITYKFHN